MAIDNKDKKILNVPPLRFPEFTEEWKAEQLDNIATLSKGIGISKEQLSEDGEPCILYGELYTKYKSEIIKQVESKTDINGSKLKRSKANDVIIPCSGETAVDIATARCVPFDNILFGGDLNVISLHQYDGAFMSYQLNGKRKYDIARVAQGVSIVHLYGEHLKAIKTYNPTLPEQQKIAKLLSLLDDRIDTQNKIIEKLQSLIKGIAQHCIKESTSGNTYVKLGDICQITTGKLDANAQVDNGIYPFFTCAEQPFKIDSFAFDTEALLISGNGANLGYINYYKGKFNAYQRTYVLDLFSENIQYIKWALKVLLPKRIAIEKSSSNTPYIVLSTLTDLRLPIPCKSKQSFIANLMQSLERKLSNQIAQYDSYNYLKQYLLRQMFI
ncbi:restriction endonuclease subunit S [Phocaeicola dorei]|jgi:type I restriction enzyme S subunit|uniref:restriction endonuclease subunit S n=1 Tax=Bacteroidales TaxID=171549 RepID=UPI00096A581C|nr:MULTISPECIES: restriction endonuclease subunit S [Bacteroidales]MBV3582474.1 restriction endonuclease subunit S [Phocaeicola dorei]MBV3607026.1 restriction endonuclease subunit S [Phocaeicola dorei]